MLLNFQALPRKIFVIKMIFSAKKFDIDKVKCVLYFIILDNFPSNLFVCSGPLENTCEDFWRMCWEKDVTTVVMLTQCVENGRVSLKWPVFMIFAHHFYLKIMYQSKQYKKIFIFNVAIVCVVNFFVQ